MIVLTTSPTTNQDSTFLLNLTIVDLSIFTSFDPPDGSNLTSNETWPDLTMNSTELTPSSATPPLLTITSTLEDLGDHGYIVAKITVLLLVTAAVLIVSYKFVVRLFLGYADRKDDVVPDDISDDEDSAVIKRAMEPSYDIDIG